MTQYIEYQIKSFKQEPQNIKLRTSKLNAMYHIHKAVVHQLLQKRQGNANCKTRSEVNGGGKKPWKQKGTGRARAGSIRSPLWRGGGVIFGPKTKMYQQKLNKKEKALAINDILYNKKDYTIALPTNFFSIDKPKTKQFLHKLADLDLEKNVKVLIIMATKTINTYLATRNLKNIEIIMAEHLNLLAIIKADYVLIENNAIEIINRKSYE